MRRFRPTYANVVSTMALVLALGGGAYAATSPSGTHGQASRAPAGPRFLGHGQTERGVYDVGGMEATGATQNFQMSAVSFAYPLNFDPAHHILFKTKTKACPGSVKHPSAMPGHLCVYQGGQWSNDKILFLDPRTQGSPGVTRLGFVLGTSPFVTSSSFGFDSHGTWAVTAP